MAEGGQPEPARLLLAAAALGMMPRENCRSVQLHLRHAQRGPRFGLDHWQAEYLDVGLRTWHWPRPQ